jgi:hypothetical protein
MEITSSRTNAWNKNSNIKYVFYVLWIFFYSIIKYYTNHFTFYIFNGKFCLILANMIH